MNLLCNLSGHSIPAVPLENQGFRFSRCTRCCQDMIRSAIAEGGDWKPVPAGFRVAWGSVDLTMFEHQSRVAARVAALRQSVQGVASVTRIGCAAACQQMGDRVRRIGKRVTTRLSPSPRIIRHRQPKLLKRRWSVVFELTVRRDIGFDVEKLAA